jgi:hypothetical protein
LAGRQDRRVAAPHTRQCSASKGCKLINREKRSV